MNEERIQLLRERLETLEPSKLEIRDDSEKHIGHVGARDGRSHFHVLIESPRFKDRSALERHQMVYDAVGDLMISDIHALQIEARCPTD
ncbi:MAG: BolA family transcriptional regulator [Gammaproteobacteria bacterium]|nr:BolA family transcriptional regulator [Gammaproteobacteria bacterium]